MANSTTLVGEFHHLADYFEHAQTSTELHAIEADAGKLLNRAVAAKILDLVLPDVAAPERMFEDQSPQWAGVWCHGVMQYAIKYRPPVENPLQLTSEYRGGPEQVIVGGNAGADWRIVAKKYAMVCRSIATTLESTTDAQDDYFVSLLQMAAVVGGSSKRTLRRMYDDAKLPDPDVPGQRGKAHQWRWSTVRPILEQLFNRPLPAKFPADRFVRSG